MSTVFFIKDEGPPTNKLPCFSYLIFDDSGTRMLLIDAAFQPVVPIIRKLIKEGINPIALLFTHRHFIGLADSWNESIGELKGAPLILHPLDAMHEQAFKWDPNVKYENPIDHPILFIFGIQCLYFPGHTKGHIIARHTPTNVLFVGDCAMTHNISHDPIISRPPAPFSANDDELIISWNNFIAEGQIPSVVAAYHGLPIWNPTMQLLQALTSSEKTKADDLVAFQLAADKKDGKTYIKQSTPL